VIQVTFSRDPQDAL